MFDSYRTLDVAMSIASGVLEGLWPDLITHLRMNYDVSAGIKLEGDTWMGVNDNKDVINLEDQMKDPESIWHFWKQAIQLRKEHREIFMHGAFEILDPKNSKSFTYVKTSAEGEKAIVCLNFSDEEQPLFLPATMLKGHVLEFLAGNLAEPKNLYLPLQAWEGRVYFLKACKGANDNSGLIAFSANDIEKAKDFNKASLATPALDAILKYTKQLRLNDPPNSPLGLVLASSQNIRDHVITDIPLSAALEATRALRAEGGLDAEDGEELESELTTLQCYFGDDASLKAYLEATQHLQEIYGDEEPPMSAILDATLHLRQGSQGGEA
jgi:hypothetical protein